MNGASVAAGGAIGAASVLAVFAAVLAGPGLAAGPSLHDGAQYAQAEQYHGSLSLEEIFSRVEAGTVRIEVRQNTPTAGFGGLGSGFVFDKSGHIITNAHVVDDASRIVVTFLDGRSYKAELVGTDAFTDIAVIRADADASLLNPLLIGDSSRLRVGEPIAAIGNPFGLSGSMTAGIVSQLGRLLPGQGTDFQIPDVIQTDAAINPGNSGGPLLNMRGEVVGINTAIQSGTGAFTGVGFAVPSQTLVKIVPSLVRDGKYEHPWIGVVGTNIDPDLASILSLPDTRGFMVISVVRDGPAHLAGMRGADRVMPYQGTDYDIGGDIIMSVDGIDVRKIDDILIHLQRQKSIGDTMDLRVLRDGVPRDITLELQQRPSR